MDFDALLAAAHEFEVAGQSVPEAQVGVLDALALRAATTAGLWA
ncbi:hypothetical protein [Kribbella italica]|uniref:Uncharacterized protein n=1 Tax=Kribbella italica TaxID=1540520 RepID=A0A7W9JD77_9ACTN|nr:hypothetical protein [Kribbella italica]MBB5839622.1 hypothetical protein [Kribbella italica]